MCVVGRRPFSNALTTVLFDRVLLCFQNSLVWRAVECECRASGVVSRTRTRASLAALVPLVVRRLLEASPNPPVPYPHQYPSIYLCGCGGSTRERFPVGLSWSVSVCVGVRVPAGGTFVGLHPALARRLLTYPPTPPPSPCPPSHDAALQCAADDFSVPVRLTIAPFSLAAAVSDAVGCGQPTETFDYLTFQPLPPAIAASAIALPHNCSTVCVVSVPTTSTAAS